LRNQSDGIYDARLDFVFMVLRHAVPGSGINEPPDIDVLGLRDAPMIA